ncbi:hypothetical protein GGI05_002462 [Coemansia sp. RSA 2603]|nr:hypothetical protein GGI05_002462 [Coemansia sp. RSA 2603]
MSQIEIWHYSRDNNGLINLEADPLGPITPVFNENNNVRGLIENWLSVFEERDNVGYVGDRDSYQLVAILDDGFAPEYGLATPEHSFKRFRQEIESFAQKLMYEEGDDITWVDVKYAVVQKWEY